jgi:phosphomannomutase
MEVSDPAAAVHKVTEQYRRIKNTARVDIQDGCKVLFPDRSWVQVRASNTEPIIRVFAEVRAADHSAAAGQAQRLIDDVKKLV